MFDRCSCVHLIKSCGLKKKEEEGNALATGVFSHTATALFYCASSQAAKRCFCMRITRFHTVMYSVCSPNDFQSDWIIYWMMCVILLCYMLLISLKTCHDCAPQLWTLVLGAHCWITSLLNDNKHLFLQEKKVFTHTGQHGVMVRGLHALIMCINVTLNLSF